MSSPAESKTDQPGVVRRRYTYAEAFCIATLEMPSQKPGMDMSLTVKVASLNAEAVYVRNYSFKDLSELCPLIGAEPAAILAILEEKPSLRITPEFGIAHIDYQFDIYIARATAVPPSKPQLVRSHCVLMLNIGEKAAKTEIESQKALDALTAAQIRIADQFPFAELVRADPAGVYAARLEECTRKLEKAEGQLADLLAAKRRDETLKANLESLAQFGGRGKRGR